MQRPRVKALSLRAALAVALALAALVLAASAASPAGAAIAAKAQATTLGIWTGAEDSGSYIAVPGQHHDIANYYLAWGQQWPGQFISQPRQRAQRRTWRSNPGTPAPAGRFGPSPASCRRQGSAAR